MKLKANCIEFNLKSGLMSCKEIGICMKVLPTIHLIDRRFQISIENLSLYNCTFFTPSNHSLEQLRRSGWYASVITCFAIGHYINRGSSGLLMWIIAKHYSSPRGPTGTLSRYSWHISSPRGI